jgi:hypothetical protein
MVGTMVSAIFVYKSISTLIDNTLVIRGQRPANPFVRWTVSELRHYENLTSVAMGLRIFLRE